MVTRVGKYSDDGEVMVNESNDLETYHPGHKREKTSKNNLTKVTKAILNWMRG